MKVYHKYTFIFDTDSGWARKDDFDNDLNSFFISNGLEPQGVTGINEDSDETIVYLSKIVSDDSLVKTTVNPGKKPNQNKKIFDKSIKQLEPKGGKLRGDT